jgi:SAM-dependent methyltransferase
MKRAMPALQRQYAVERELGLRLRSATAAERRILYGEVYEERLRRIPDHPLVEKSKGGRTADRELRNQLGIVRPFLRPESVYLEVGPGDCSLALQVSQLVKKVYAADVSAGLLRRDPRELPIEFIQFDGIEIPIEPNTVDVAFSGQVLEHLHPDDAFAQLASILEALKDGGVFVCTTPNRLSGPWDVSRYFDQEASGLHLKEYTLRELAALLRSAGFSSVTAVATWHGHVLLKRIPIRPLGVLEAGLERLPRGPRRQLARVMALFKLVAVKGGTSRRSESGLRRGFTH